MVRGWLVATRLSAALGNASSATFPSTRGLIRQIVDEESRAPAERCLDAGTKVREVIGGQRGYLCTNHRAEK